MTDREWRATHCVECHGTDPDEGWHERCGCHEIPTATTNRERMGPAKTNGPGLSPGTVLATPIQTSEREDYRTW